MAREQQRGNGSPAGDPNLAYTSAFPDDNPRIVRWPDALLPPVALPASDPVRVKRCPISAVSVVLAAQAGATSQAWGQCTGGREIVQTILHLSAPHPKQPPAMRRSIGL